MVKGKLTGKILTGSKSRSKTGRYYWYYRAPKAKEYYSAIKVHKMIDSVLEQLSFTTNQYDFFKERCRIEFENKSKDSEGVKKSIRSDIASLQIKLLSLEEKFIESKEISSDLFDKWHNKYSEELRQKEMKLSSYDDTNHIKVSKFYKMLEKVKNIATIYGKLDVIGKQRLLITLFGSEFVLGKEGVGTRKLNPIFIYKANEINGLHYVKQQKTETIFTSFPSGTEGGNFLSKLSIIKCSIII